jgi:hypothetical protein
LSRVILTVALSASLTRTTLGSIRRPKVDIGASIS